MESEAMTPILQQLVERAALPLRSIESTFAAELDRVQYVPLRRWYDEKYGVQKSGREWVKAQHQ